MPEPSYLKGAFIAYEPQGYPNGDKRVIPFRFNPESLSRQLTLEQAQKDSGTDSGGGGKGGDAAADASSGKLKESFQVVVRLDFADRHQSSQSLDAEYGIAPELAALEDLLYGAPTPQDENSDGQEAVKQSPQRPTVLFVWGRRRVLPVKIASMAINETTFNQHLNPLRAEVTVSLEVLSEADAKDNKAVSDALKFTDSKRREMARLFLDHTSDQGSRILPL